MQTRKGGYKSDGKYTKPHPCIFLTLKCGVKDVGMEKALFLDFLFLVIMRTRRLTEVTVPFSLTQVHVTLVGYNLKLD